MPAGTLNLLAEQGATLSLRLTVRDSNNALVDLTGWTGVAHIKRAYGDVTPVVSFTVSFTGEPGVVVMTLPAADTWKLTATIGVVVGVDHIIHGFIYDLVLIKPDATTVRVLQGVLSAALGVTHL